MDFTFQILLDSQNLRNCKDLTISNVFLNVEKEVVEVTFESDHIVTINVEKVFQYREHLVSQAESAMEC